MTASTNCLLPRAGGTRAGPGPGPERGAASTLLPAGVTAAAAARVADGARADGSIAADLWLAGLPVQLWSVDSVVLVPTRNPTPAPTLAPSASPTPPTRAPSGAAAMTSRGTREPA